MAISDIRLTLKEFKEKLAEHDNSLISSNAFSANITN